MATAKENAMKMVLQLLAIVAITIPTFAHARDKKTECHLDKFIMDLRETGGLLSLYAEISERDRKTCKIVDIDVYRLWNEQIETIMKRYGCTWDSLEAFRKIETISDLGCPEPDDDVAPVSLVDNEDSLALVPLVPIESEPVSRAVEAAPLPEPELAPITPLPKEKSHHLSTFGIIVGGVGVAMLGGGGIVGAMADSDAKSANAADVQLDTQRFNQQAKGKAGTANVILGIGGALAAAGTAMTIIDWVILNDSQKVKVSVGPTGAHLTIRW